jgi:hypothetical protein
MENISMVLQAKMEIIIREIEELCGLSQSNKKSTIHNAINFNIKVISNHEVAAMLAQTTFVTMSGWKSNQRKNIGATLASFSQR